MFRRGRWRAWSSLRRYGKEAKLQADLSKVSGAVLEYGRAWASNIEAMFQHPYVVPLLPHRRVE